MDDLTRAFGNGMTYVGWSEDISGTRVVEGGEYMAEKVNLDTARILAHHNLARDGFDGRPDAHRGDSDADLKKYHVGADLTNEYIRNNFFVAGEASNAFGIKNAVYRERDSLRSQLAAANKRITELSNRPDVSPEITAELETLRKANADVLAKNEELAAEASKLAAQAEADKSAGERFFRLVGQFISKYLPGNK
ncbi:hypothetical protein RCF27_09445 [Rhodococcus pyridinivorans]|uniref:hypothetical protein n=1 Tax=Rhodococcus pyridinivorans TaxID=103816 RepID=UPI00280B82F9|nr:hypothetical protein [Rhodococcus pyridinivorans]WMM74482.1 hypothetical protein RCF27_09445 [Rhodococcus pyridinivorans]